MTRVRKFGTARFILRKNLRLARFFFAFTEIEVFRRAPAVCFVRNRKSSRRIRKTNKSYANHASRSSESSQTKNASCAEFHGSAKAGFAEDGKSETAQRPESDCHRRQFRHWPVHR